MAQTVIGIFDNASEAQEAVQALVIKGFSRDNIDISSSASNTNPGGQSSQGVGSTDINRSNDYDDNEKEGSSIGRFFKNLFGDDDDQVNTYSGVANRSGSVVTVHVQSSDEAERAADILDDYGAVDVNERASQYGYNSTTGTSSLRSDNTTNEGASSIPIIEENLQVDKGRVQTGGARIRSRIIEKPVEENLRLREEHVRVERTTVDRPATEADFQNFKEGTIEMVETTEVPLVSKEARVVEEISLNKDVEEREETIRDTVRSTEVDIENLDKDDVNRNRNSQDDWSNR
jgi:uncharacterized protein (TIGR02271 family)